MGQVTWVTLSSAWEYGTPATGYEYSRYYSLLIKYNTEVRFEMATATPAGKTKVTTYDDPSKMNVHDFIKAMLKEMLLADNDTLTMDAEISNPDGSKANIKFEVKISEVVTK
jgi:hypothetical protein